MMKITVQFPAPAPNAPNLIDIEIDLPNINFPQTASELSKVIKGKENLNCYIHTGSSNKQFKGDITSVFIVRGNNNGTICEYELHLPGKLCSNLKGEETILPKWTFIYDFDTDMQGLNNLLNTIRFKRIF